MNIKGKNQRQLRKQVLRHVESTFDLARLEYKTRVTPQKHRAKLTGVMVAGVAYMLGFGLAFYALKAGTTSYDTFSKFSRIFMLPASVIGVFAYFLLCFRRVFSVAKDIIDYMTQLEGHDGLLWRYAPILAELLRGDVIAEQLAERSRHGDLPKAEPEDFANLIHRLHEALTSGEGTSLSDEAVDAMERNQAKTRSAARGDHARRRHGCRKVLRPNVHGLDVGFRPPRRLTLCAAGRRFERSATLNVRASLEVDVVNLPAGWPALCVSVVEKKKQHKNQQQRWVPR